MALFIKGLFGFLLFCLICGLVFVVYIYLDKKFENKSYKDLLTYLATFLLAFALAVLTAPFMGYGENPLDFLFK